MTIAHAQDVYIVSDLHLDASPDRTGHVAAFTRFLGHVARQAHARGRPTRLILLGDIFDLVQVNWPPCPDDAAASTIPHAGPGSGRAGRRAGAMHPGTTAADTCWRLDQIAARHPGWFAALGTFLADAAHQAPATVEFVIGNHDLELSWPAAQRHLRTLIQAHGGGRDHSAQIRVHPWLLYEPGFFYAEHGHQYDAFSSSAAQLAPYRPDDDQAIALPPGSAFMRCVANRLIHERDADPGASGPLGPTWLRLLRGLRRDPMGKLRLLRDYARFLRALRGQPGDPWGDPQVQRARHERYQREVVAPYADTLGVRADQLVAIDALARPPALHDSRRLIVQAVVPPVLLLTLCWGVALGGRGTRHGAGRRQRGYLPVSLGLLTAVIGLAFLEGVRLLSLHLATVGDEATSDLGQISAAIAAILGTPQDPEDAPAGRAGGAIFYIFGHTHRARLLPLTSPSGAIFINTGTWTLLPPEAGHTQPHRWHVAHLSRTADGSTAAALLIWNDTTGQLDPDQPGYGEQRGTLPITPPWRD